MIRFDVSYITYVKPFYFHKLSLNSCVGLHSWGIVNLLSFEHIAFTYNEICNINKISIATY